MSFDVTLAHENGWSRVVVQGNSRLGRLLSLLQVLEVDSASWTREAVLLDLRGLQAPLAPDEQLRLASEAARALRRMKRIAILVPQGHARGVDGVRVFEREAAAREWLG